MLPQAIRDHLEQALRGLRYGTVQLVVHDAQIVRIERVERISLPAAPKHQRGVAAQAGLSAARESVLPFAAQAGLTGSPEALATEIGQPTPSPEVRHETSQERSCGSGPGIDG